MIKIAIGADHGGYEYKQKLIQDLTEKGYEMIDVGAYSTEPADWSTYGIKAAMKVQSKEADMAIVICKSGIGVNIAANKVKGVRSALLYNDEIASSAKQHDGANVAAFGSLYMTYDEVLRRSLLFIDASFEGGRHAKRVDILTNYETNKKL